MLSSTIIVVSSFLTITRSALPKNAGEIEANSIPSSSIQTSAPVNTPISTSIFFLESPNPGAFTATHFNTFLIVLITRAANASPSTSSATSNKLFPSLATDSNIGIISCTRFIFLLTSKT